MVVRASSGTSRPRQPISSPSALITDSHAPMVIVDPIQRNIPTGRGPAKWMKRMNASVFAQFGTAPKPSAHTAAYATVAYAIGMA